MFGTFEALQNFLSVDDKWDEDGSNMMEGMCFELEESQERDEGGIFIKKIIWGSVLDI